MKRLVLLRPAAETDLAAARDWYEQRQTGLGFQFLDEVARALRRFPYKVFYQVIGPRVVIFRVLHARQEHGKRLG